MSSVPSMSHTAALICKVLELADVIHEQGKWKEKTPAGDVRSVAFAHVHPPGRLRSSARAIGCAPKRVHFARRMPGIMHARRTQTGRQMHVCKMRLKQQDPEGDVSVTWVLCIHASAYPSVFVCACNWLCVQAHNPCTKVHACCVTDAGVSLSRKLFRGRGAHADAHACTQVCMHARAQVSAHVSAPDCRRVNEHANA